MKVILHVQTFSFIGKLGSSLAVTLGLCFHCPCTHERGQLAAVAASVSSDKSKEKSGDQ